LQSNTYFACSKIGGKGKNCGKLLGSCVASPSDENHNQPVKSTYEPCAIAKKDKYINDLQPEEGWGAEQHCGINPQLQEPHWLIC